jgi:hypothetical protein
MHVIQIPGTGMEKGQHPDDKVGTCCVVDLQFSVAGDFQANSEGKHFYPALPQGPVTAKSQYQCTSPNHPINKVTWTFTDTSDGFVTVGTINVVAGGDCNQLGRKLAKG